MSNYEDEIAAPISEDDELDIDFAGSKDAFVVPNGKHAMVCVDAVKGVSKSGNKMITWTFRAGESAKRLEFKTWTVLNEASLWKLDEVLFALGLKTKEQERAKFKLRDAIGRQVMCVMKLGTNGKGGARSEIDSLLPHPDGAVKGSAKEDAPF